MDNILGLFEKLESQSLAVQPSRCVVVRNRNASCRRCAEACPTGAIRVEGNDLAVAPGALRRVRHLRHRVSYGGVGVEEARRQGVFCARPWRPCRPTTARRSSWMLLCKRWPRASTTRRRWSW